jgi:hypothetical protein
MTSTIRRAIVRLAAMALPVAAVSCIGGVDNKFEPQQITPLGGGSSSGGTTGGYAVGLYKMSAFNGGTLPDTIIAPGVDSVENGDSTRIIVAILDSAELQLDTDSTVIEKDYFQLARDVRAGAGISNPTLTFNLAYAIMTDSVICTGGTYVDTSSEQTSFDVTSQGCYTYGASFTRLGNTYAIGGDSLVGSTFYQYYDSAATLLWPPFEQQVSVTWKYFSAPVITAQHGTAAPRGSIRKGRRINLQ